MRQSFEEIGLGQICVPLLQGMAFSAPLPLPPSPLDADSSVPSDHGINVIAGLLRGCKY